MVGLTQMFSPMQMPPGPDGGYCLPAIAGASAISGAGPSAQYDALGGGSQSWGGASQNMKRGRPKTAKPLCKKPTDKLGGL